MPSSFLFFLHFVTLDNGALDDPIIEAGPTDRPPAPPGFHYRVDVPSKLCTFIADEDSKTKKEKYRHMFVRLPDVNGQPQLRCVCNKSIKVAFYKNRETTNDDDIDHGNFVSHSDWIRWLLSLGNGWRYGR